MFRAQPSALALSELLSQLGEGVSEELHLAEVVITLRDPHTGETYQFVRSRQRMGVAPNPQPALSRNAIISRPIEFHQDTIGRIEFHSTGRPRALQLLAAAQELAERLTNCIALAAPAH